MPRIRTILKRRDTAANWSSVNPILLSGEEGFETDTRKSKVGDGLTAWSGLSYAYPSTGGSGSTFKPFNTRRVASSTATADEKASADYICDGTGDEVEINNALAALQSLGGRVILSGGTFNLANTVALTGGSNFADNPYVELVGQGVDTTILAPASGVHAITLTNTPKPGIKMMRINLSGASDGIRCTAPTTGSNDRRGFWMGAFEDLKIQGNFSNHTGWAINMESPFRSTFKRIQGLGIKNGVWLKSHYANFNPGNLTFDDCHMDLSQAGGNAYWLQSADNGGFFNICTFIECDAIDSSGSTTNSIGWRFSGSTTTYFTTRDVLVLRSNVEQFKQPVVLEHAANIEFNGNYIDSKDGGTVFTASGDSVNNYLSTQYLYVSGNKTVSAINDANTDSLKPNILRNSFARVEGGSTLTVLPSSATILERLARDSDGSGVYPAAWRTNIPVRELIDTAYPTAGTITAGQMAQATGAGAYVAPTPASVVPTNNPQRFGITNRTTTTQTLQFPNPAGTIINLTIGPGEVLTLRQMTTSGYINESGNKPKAWLDSLYTSTSGVTAGSNVTITGAGTAASPFVISSIAGITRSINLINTLNITTDSVANVDYVYYWTGSTSYGVRLATAANNKNRYTFMNKSSISQTIVFQTGESADGSTSITMNAGSTLEFISNGTNWMIA